MKQVDWPMVVFVGSSLVHEFWIYYGLPKVYIWDIKQQFRNEQDNNKSV